MTTTLTPNEKERLDWHRLFGIAVTLHFIDYPLDIELEKEMAIKSQLLDVLIIKKGSEPIEELLPDGLEDLAEYNLLTYKSLREPLDDWVLKELTGHYANCRKQVSPSLDNLLPEERFRLFAVTTRFPRKLVRQSGSNWQSIKKGVYQVKRNTDLITVIVLKEIPKAKRNAIWQLFSTQPEKVQDAVEYYSKTGTEINTIINEMLEKYKVEGINMPYTLQDFRKDYVRARLNWLTVEERMAGLTPQERLAGLAPEERLAGLAPKERLAGLAPEERLAGLAPEDILAGLKPTDREWLAKSLSAKQNDESEVPE